MGDHCGERKEKWHQTLPLRRHLCRWSHGLGDEGKGWWQTLGRAGAYGAVLVADEKCWRLWGQHHCLPGWRCWCWRSPSCRCAVGGATGVSALARGDRAPATGWLCKVHSKTGFDCEVQFLGVVTIGSPGENPNQPPKVTPPKQSLHFQQMLSAESSPLPSSNLKRVWCNAPSALGFQFWMCWVLKRR